MTTNADLPAFALDFLDDFSISGTAQTYGYGLRRLAEFMIKTGYSSLESTDTWRDDLLVKFYKWLMRRPYTMPTRANYMAATKRYLFWLDASDKLPKEFRVEKAVNRWLVARGGGSYGARSAVRTPDPGTPSIVAYYDSIPLPYPDTHHDRRERLRILRARAIVHTLYASAGRVSEVASLTREAVLDGRLSEIRITGKGNKERMLFLTPEACRAISNYCRERGKDSYSGLFISHGRNRGRSLGRGSLWNIVKAAAKAIGLHQGTSPHSFRHYRAQQLLNEGMDIEVLQAVLGHTSIDLTRRVYAPDTPLEKLRDQLETFGKSAAEAAR